MTHKSAQQAQKNNCNTHRYIYIYPGPGYLHSKDGVVWLWHPLVNLYIYIYIYIYIWYIWYSPLRNLWNSYRKLAWVGFEPMTTGFCSDALTALTDWAIRPWVHLAIRSNFVQLLQFHRLFSVRSHFGYCLRQLPGLFESKASWGNHMR